MPEAAVILQALVPQRFPKRAVNVTPSPQVLMHQSYPFLRRTGLALGLLLLAAPWARAQVTYTVCPGGGCFSTSIQAAVDAASSGDEVFVLDGTYEEQVVVDNKALTIRGKGASMTTIQAPATMAACFSTGSGPIYPVVCALNGADVTLQDVTVDGFGRGNGHYRFVGVGFRNAGGTVQNAVVTGIRETPFSGTQHGVAVYAFNDDGVARSLAVLGNQITDFQKNGMALNTGGTTPLAVTVEGNTVTGVGPTTVTAQNGIQVFGTHITGSVDDNTVTGIAYDGASFVATSVLNYYASVDAAGNTVTGAQTAFYWYDGSGTIADNTVGVVEAGDYSFGIIGSDPPRAVPAPFEPPAGALRGSGGGLVVNVVDNDVTFSGGSNANTYGIEADAGYGPSDLAFTATGNTVSGFAVGVGLYACQSGCSTGVFTGVDVHQNDLSGNTLAVETNTTDTADAALNYYGDLDPSDDVAGDVDYSPWLAFVPGTSPQHYYTNDAIQEAVDAAADGDEVFVLPGTYVENVSVVGKDLAIRSTGGRAVTTVEGISNAGALGAVLVDGTTSGFTLEGFTVVGIDNGLPGIENAAVYVRGTHTGLSVLDSEVEAAGDHGFLAEFGAVLTNPTLSGNVFSGQSFVGPQPAGYGFSQQFTLPNVPRQLVALGNGGGVSGANVTGLVFTNNQVTGTTGGINASSQEQGNTAATLDAENATITGNTFAATTTSPFASQLRVRRPGATISGNTFDGTGLGYFPNQLFIQNNAATLDAIAAANTFDRGVYVDGSTAIAASIQPTVAVVPTGTTVEVLPGTYVEQVVVDAKALTPTGAGDDVTSIRAPATLAACFNA
jgi:hypothetical protein